MVAREINVKYEIHVNGYGLGKDLGERFLGLGFYVDEFDRSKIQTHAPPYHFTFRTYGNRRRLNEVWNRAEELVKQDKSFLGYIEAETVPEHYRKTFDEKPFRN